MKSPIPISLFVLACAPLLGQNSAAVQGTVTDDGGRPLAANLVLRRIPEFLRTRLLSKSHAPQERVPGDPDVNLTIAAAADGLFAFAGLPAGLYEVCATAPQSEYLATCQWSRPLTFTVTAGERQVGKQIRLARGARVRVRLNDPNGHLSAARITVGLGAASGAFHAVPVTANDTRGRDHAITVPFDTPLFIWVSSRDLQVAEDHGQAVARLGSAFRFSVPAGTPGPTFTFNITGPAK